MLASSSRKLESDSPRCENPRLSLFGKRSREPSKALAKALRRSQCYAAQPLTSGTLQVVVDTPAHPFDAARYVDETAAAIGLPIAPEHRPVVVENFRQLAASAALVMAFPLPNENAPARVF